MIKTTKIIFAIPAAAAEIPPNPNIPAIIATITQITNNLIITNGFILCHFPPLGYYKTLNANILTPKLGSLIKSE